MKYFGIYGAGAFSRCIINLILEKLDDSGLPKKNFFFIDDNSSAHALSGFEIISLADFQSLQGSKSSIVAVSDPIIRREMSRRLKENEVEEFSLISRDLIKFQNVKIGKSAIICPRFSITCDVVIGDHFHGNIGGIVEHDCVIGNFVTLSPGVICNGNVLIEDNVFIGSGAVIRNGKSGKPLVIGKNAVVGMGCVVTKDVPADTIVAGNPAKVLN